MKQLVLCFLSFFVYTCRGQVQNSTRIFDGEDAKKNMYQYMAGLFDVYDDDPWYFCGGTLIAEDVVLTAASCVGSLNSLRYTKVSIKGKQTQYEGVELHSIKKKVLHPRYEEDGSLSNIALLFLKSKSKITPVKLHNRNKNSAKGVILGWGYLEDDPYMWDLSTDNDRSGDSQLNHRNGNNDMRGGAWSYHWCDPYHEYEDICDLDLQVAQTPIVSDKKCKKLYPHLFNKDEGHFCVGARRNVGDTCHGDSGGPFLINNKQYGIMVWHEAICGNENSNHRYSVYTEIHPYYEWIWKTINKFHKTEFSTLGKGFCRTNMVADGDENGVGKISEQGVLYRFCDANKKSGCSLKACENKCRDDEACMAFEYWDNRNKKTGTCEIHLTPADKVEENSGATCYKKEKTYNCNYKPVGGGYCREADGSAGTYTKSCSVDIGLCDFDECARRCDMEPSCTAIEYHSDRGMYTGTCDLHTGAITKVKRSEKAVCFWKEKMC